MFTALAVLKIRPELKTPLVEACNCNFTVDLIVAPTSATEPDCHRSGKSAACVIPRGFPSQPALGLALTGDRRVLEINWAVQHPNSAFAPGDSGWVTQDDVDLLNKAGLCCHTVKPYSPTPDPAPSDGPSSNSKLSTLEIVGISAGGVALLACVVVGGVLVHRSNSLKKRALAQDLLLASNGSTSSTLYTEN